VRAEVLAYARHERAAGRSWARIASTVGLSAGALANWAQSPPPARRLMPVAVAPLAPEIPGAALVVVSPGGYRVEGLDVPTATALLRALG
jgi:hypothetical protein